ncbi:nicotinate-nucleotide adenylyltransferase [Microbulbifer yueqingensis]|uniref:Probable nicotinate-nucleotide adenylyltransferase n=1 Tax=Microbulbifer yueqingensis TaxID=658219 RepID=A0A1G8XCL3_9GAMM|nr:nicotinate-nucleotide adenylyltransferase [Microbulbifer yueqingensis]SDJ88104.1 nicotinate-nucleotide adenylyltransferase [Microbulbifer yueqingensis]
MAARQRRHTIALFGGTFDPVHFGHLRMALELKEALAIDEMRLVPSHRPAHRETPGVSAEHRCQMLEIALRGCPELQLDKRELRRGGATYTVDTLEELRAELGTEVSLSFCMGLDSLLTLPSWHRWERLLELAHLVVVARPGWQLPQGGRGADQGELAQLLGDHAGTPEDLRREAGGRLLVREQTLLPISATHIRQLVAGGRSPRFLLPAAVLEYIEDHQLYREAGTGSGQ